MRADCTSLHIWRRVRESECSHRSGKGKGKKDATHEDVCVFMEGGLPFREVDGVEAAFE